jgi:thiol:disulfide interchange protein
MAASLRSSRQLEKNFKHNPCRFIIHHLNQLAINIAFKPTARALDGQTIEVRFEIAKGYYLYRDKFRFAAEPGSRYNWARR